MTVGRLDRVGTYLVLCTFSLIAIYPVLSILFLALHRKTDLVTGFAFPTRIDLSSYEAAWTEATVVPLTRDHLGTQEIDLTQRDRTFFLKLGCAVPWQALRCSALRAQCP